MAARGTAGRKAGRCAGCDTRYLGAYLRFGRVAWQCGCDMRGSHLRSGGLSRRMWRLRDLRRVALRQAVASAPAARQSAARNGVGMAEWPIRHALCSGRIDAQAGYRAACGGYAICGAFVLSQSVALDSSCTAIRGTYRRWQSGVAGAVRIMLRPNRRLGGYRAACGGYAICGAQARSQAGAPGATMRRITAHVSAAPAPRVAAQPAIAH